MSKEKILSFIMPTYNSAEYISETLKSIVRMVNNNEEYVELILVDDGSNDNTIAIIENFAANHRFVKIIRNAHRGVSAARNLGINYAIGKYITFLDSDDYFSSNFVDIFIKLATSEADVIFADVKGINKNADLKNATESNKLDIIESLFKIGRFNIHPGIPAKFFKLSFFKEHKITYNSNMVLGEDMVVNVEAIVGANHIFLSKDEFYFVKESHSMRYFNKLNLLSQKVFLSVISEQLSSFKNKIRVNDILTIARLKAMSVIVERYFGPLYSTGNYKLLDLKEMLKNEVKNLGIDQAVKRSDFDKNLSLRYRVIRILLVLSAYGASIIFTYRLDQIKRYNRFRD